MPGGPITIIRGGGDDSSRAFAVPDADASFVRNLPPAAPDYIGGATTLPPTGPAPVATNIPLPPPLPGSSPVTLPLVTAPAPATRGRAPATQGLQRLVESRPGQDAPLPNNSGLLHGMVADERAFSHLIVYFAYDSTAVATREATKISQVAQTLRVSATTRVVVDGHCDERGTEEYNRALGERRALSIRAQLIREGVSADRIYTRSFGKDRPLVTGHGEESWWQNRRGQFVLLRPRN